MAWAAARVRGLGCDFSNGFDPADTGVDHPQIAGLLSPRDLDGADPGLTLRSGPRAAWI
ncbi:hypothetical protein [Pseudogemmobacter sonorensis]|uniref:hypothetical protein n=1 Tax=Pseudogemmobacter sonorensis TaxID=2989681 RepID=UPI0036BFF47D